jgi:hypothetical protein
MEINISQLIEEDARREEKRVRHLSNRYIRQHMNRIRNRARKAGFYKHTNITAKELRQLWNKQCGRCALTGELMSFTYSSVLPYDAGVVSLIEPRGPYSKDNVRWVTRHAALAKAKASDRTLFKLCRHVLECAGYRVEFHDGQPDLLRARDLLLHYGWKVEKPQHF